MDVTRCRQVDACILLNAVIRMMPCFAEVSPFVCMLHLTEDSFSIIRSLVLCREGLRSSEVYLGDFPR